MGRRRVVGLRKRNGAEETGGSGANLKKTCMCDCKLCWSTNKAYNTVQQRLVADACAMRTENVLQLLVSERAGTNGVMKGCHYQIVEYGNVKRERHEPRETKDHWNEQCKNVVMLKAKQSR